MSGLPVTQAKVEPAEPRSAIDLFRARVRKTPLQPAMRAPTGAGTFRTYTFADWDTASREIAAGLLAQGVKRGDRIVLLAATRYEWYLCDVAIGMAGAVTVPIYPSVTAEQADYIVGDSGARVAIVDTREQLAKLTGQPSVARTCESFVCWDATSSDEAAKMTSLEALRERGRAHLSSYPECLDAIAETLGASDVFTIVYTSGTTGQPKGVVLTHGNIVFECIALRSGIQTGTDDEQLLFLPLAHIFAKILEWMAISEGSCTSFARGIATLKEDLVAIEPTYMGAVPRVYEKFYAGILAQVRDAPPIRQKIFYWAMEVGKRVSRERQQGREPAGVLAIEYALARKLVFLKLRQRLGLRRMRLLISGGAPLAREIAEFFHALDLLILEGYGLTETTSATHVNRLDRYRFGTVGLAIPGVEVKLADDGEVLVRGGNVLAGYYRREAETREVLDADGWFHTGDVGMIEDGFLRITDRKKDLIVTSGGKKVAPQFLEGTLKARCPYVSQVLVCGEGRNFLSALVTLQEEAVVRWARSQGLTGAFAELVTDPKVAELVGAAIEEVNRSLASYETIKRFKILPHDFTQEAGELTPSLKVRRKFVEEKYKDVLAAFYA